MENTSGIQPVEYKVLVLPEEVQKQTEGGIYLPDQTKEKEEWAQTIATVIAVGGSAFKDPDWNQPIPQIGSQIVMNKYAGDYIEGDDGKEYRVISDKEIKAIKI